MTKLIIEQYPNKSFYCVPFLPVAKVNIHRTVRNYLSSGVELNRKNALDIFKVMKWKSDAKATLLHPVSLISLGASCIALYNAVTPVGILVDIVLRVIASIGVFALGLAFDSLWLNRVFEVTYKEQSQKLAEYITTLEADPTITVELAPLKPAPLSFWDKMAFWKA